MSKVLAVVKKVWAAEPVVVAGLVTAGVTAGVITAAQGTAIQAIGAALVELVATIGVRTQVSPKPTGK